MIAPLRKAHRRMFVALAVVLPAVFIAGLAMRHAEPSTTPAVVIYDRQSAQRAFTAEIRGDEVEIAVARNQHVPDPLLYWSTSRPAKGALPADAKLLGRPGERLNVTRPGVLLLYSGAHRAVVDTMELP